MAKQSFPGSAFHPSLGAEVVRGTISFDHEGLFFFSENGKVEIPFRRLLVRTDKDNERIFFNDSEASVGSIFTDDCEIFEHRAFLHVSELREQVARLTGTKNAWVKLVGATGIFLALFLLVVVGVFWAGGFTVRYLVNKVPTTYESDMGDKIVANVRSQKLLSEDPKRMAMLEAMGRQLLPKEARSRFKFEFHIISMAEPNAFAVPGGKIFVTQGALQLLSRDELAGVLSHEISHVVKRHALRQIISSFGTYALLRLLVQGDSAFQSALGDASEMLFSRGFSKALENEADDGGWDYLVAAKIDPRCLPDSLRKLELAKRQGEKPDRDASQIFSTHPLTSERLKRFETKWNALQKEPGFAGFPKSLPEKGE